MRALLLAPCLLLAGCGLTPAKFDDRFETKFCAEYEACFEDFDCDEQFAEPTDTSSCDFDANAASACLEGTWTCVTNQGQPFVSIPGECAEVYTNCDEPTGTGTPTGTATGGS